MDEITIKQGEAVSGMEKYTPNIETQGYDQKRGRSSNFVPTTAFCPQCSTLYEWDAKWGEPKPKWKHHQSDFCFDLVYETDENGETFVRCKTCGHDLRNEPKEMSGSTQGVAKRTPAEKKKQDFHQEWLKNVKLHNGSYVMSLKEFKRMAVIGYSSGLKMNPCAKVGGTSYFVLWQDFLNHYEEFTIDGVKSIGIARQHWKML